MQITIMYRGKITLQIYYIGIRAHSCLGPTCYLNLLRYFPLKDQESLLRCLASVLHICDVSFCAADEGSSLSNPSQVEMIAELLQVDPKELAACLIQEATVTRGRCSITVASSPGHSHAL